MDNIKIITNPTQEAWNYVMDNSSFPHIFQSWEWGETYSKIKDIYPLKFLALVNGKPTGILLACEWKGKLLSYAIISGGGGGGGGPVIINNIDGEIRSLVHQKLILACFEASRQKNSLECRINTYPGSYDKVSESNFWCDINYTPIIKLGNNQEDMLYKIISKKTRNQILKSFKNGVTIEKGTRDNLADYLNAQKVVCKRRELTRINSLENLNLIYDNLSPKGMLKFYIAKHEERILGGGLFLYFKKSVIYKSGAMNEEGMKLAAHDALQWRVISDAIEDGYEIYNMGGATKDKNSDKYGGTEFKMGFGAKLTPFNSYYRINRKLLRAMVVRAKKWVLNKQHKFPFLTFP